MLQRGQRLPVANLTSESVLTFRVEIEGIEPNQIRVFGVNLNQEEFVAYERGMVADTTPESACGSLAWVPGFAGQVQVDLQRIPLVVQRVCIGLGFVDSRGGSGITTRDIRGGAVTIRVGEQELARLELRPEDFEGESALRVMELYRKDGWRIQVTNAGFLGGIPAMMGRWRIPVGVVQQLTAPNRLIVHTQRSQNVVVPSAWPGAVQPAVPGALSSAVGLIVLELADGGTATGTGFFINPGGYLVTCDHVVEGAAKILFCANGDTIFRECTVVRSDSATDLAILHVTDQQGSPTWLLLTEPTAEPRLGQEIGLLGYPLGARLGRDISYSQGIVNSVRRNDSGVSMLQIDAGAAPGSSGSPVFDRQSGRVVGVLSSGLRMEQQGMLINFASDLRQLWQPSWGLTLK